MSLTFEWDPAKADFNFRKHGVSFAEAMSAFADVLSLSNADPDHSDEERRYLLFGMSYLGRLPIVAHTERAEKIRIISARRASRHEKRTYEENED